MKYRRLVLMICSLLIAILCNIIISTDAEALESQDTSISSTNQMVKTRAQISVENSSNFNNASGFVDAIYVTNHYSNTVSVIDPQNNMVIKNIDVGIGPEIIETFGDYIYVANLDSDTVSVIDPHSNTAIKSIDMGDFPTFINTFGDYVYVASTDANTISVIDPHNNTVIKNIDVGNSPTDIGALDYK